MQKITPFLWFDTQAEEAARFYTSLFKNSRITEVNRYGEGAPMPAGTVLTVEFELEGQRFVALNGGPQYSFTPAVSFYVDCENQAEVDRLWDALLEGGEPEACGWLRDRYGVTWQIIPKGLTQMLLDPDAEKAQRVMHAMLQMVKIDLAELERAYAGA